MDEKNCPTFFHCEYETEIVETQLFLYEIGFRNSVSIDIFSPEMNWHSEWK